MDIQHSLYDTAGGVTVQRYERRLPYEGATDPILERLDCCRGLLLGSSFEYPGRYTRWEVGFVNPPIAITARGRRIRIDALNRRGELMLPELHRAVLGCSAVRSLDCAERSLTLRICDVPVGFAEEERSRQPGVFSVLRAIAAHFHSDRDAHLGLYGAFGYDLAFQFEAVELHQCRAAEDRDLVLYLPDELVVVDHHARQATSLRYEFVCREADSQASPGRTTTGGLRRDGAEQAPSQQSCSELAGESEEGGCDHRPGEYADTVRRAQQHFRDGRLFEVVPGQVFTERCRDTPAEIFRRLREANPAPYGALVNLGEQEYLVSASPEMYVKVRGAEVETCPISGTAARGRDAMEDADQIRRLLNSAKDEAELSMCTDVDRNDKSRVCVPGSVRVVGRRQIELYSRLIHTVDHVKGQLAPEYDALDAFLTHTWAVTVTGAPKAAAMEFIERHEKSPRRWYGGAIGVIGFDGNLNTGLTLRTIHIRHGVAEVRAGATLLMDSEPEAEEAETRLKASALLAAVRGDTSADRYSRCGSEERPRALKGAERLRVLVVDHRDSFVHNLGSFFREFGVTLTTLRPDLARCALRQHNFDLVVLSPGPGRPADFGMQDTLSQCLAQGVPVFGVCLGLQGIVEYFGGSLGQLDYPVHGKCSRIAHDGNGLFAGLPPAMRAGRYHSLHARELPDCLAVTARSDDDAAVVMAVRHRELPLAAVQFHPESIMTLEGQAGHLLVGNVLADVLNRLRLAAEADVQYVMT